MKPRATLGADGFTQKSLLQTIRPCTATVGELFRPSLTLKTWISVKELGVLMTVFK